MYRTLFYVNIYGTIQTFKKQSGFWPTLHDYFYISGLALNDLKDKVKETRPILNFY